MLNFRIDQLSFWIGFVAATFFWWLFRQARPAFSLLGKVLRERAGAVREGLSVSTEQRFRQDAITLYLQEHLAAPLFSITEVAVAPRLITPPPPVIPNQVLPPESITDIAIPYLPDMPEVASHFNVKTITIPEAMSKGGDLLVMGTPGSGRSFALYHLAALAAQRHPDAGDLGDLIPICFHAGALDPGKQDKPLEALYQVFAERVSLLTEASLLDFFEQTLQAGLALVMVDGLDDLPESERRVVVQILEKLQQTYPGNRYILSTSPQDLSCQEDLGLFPFAIAGWDAAQKTAFIENWSELWSAHITSQAWAGELPEIYDPLVLNAWLVEDAELATPFTLTLKTWAAYAGDSRGPGDLDALEAYLRRVTAGIKNARPALENLAAQSVLDQTPFLKRRTANGYIAEFEEEPEPEETPEELPAGENDAEQEIPPEESPDEEQVLSDDELESILDEIEHMDEMEYLPTGEEVEETVEDVDEVEALDQEAGGKPGEEEELEIDEETGKPRGRWLLPLLTSAGILDANPNGLVFFRQPIVAGYLAAAAIHSGENLQMLDSQPHWSGKALTQRYLPAAGADMTSMIREAVRQSRQDPLQTALVEASTWLRYATQKAAWRNNFLRSLAKILRDESLPLGLRTRLMAAMALSGEPGIASLYKQMLSSSIHSARWLGVLGCGLTLNTSAVIELGLLLYDPSLYVSRAACLSLVTINTTPALELVTAALLEANDEVRRAAAEALAQHPAEGHPVLKDGASVKDVQVRRAVVFGLARVKEPWAQEILEEIQIEDDQWVVRNAALQVLEDQKIADISIPEEMPPIHDTPWLVEFASERGMGISPGQSGWDLLQTVMVEGSEEEKLAAMYIYRRFPSESFNAISPMLDLLAGPEGEMREAAYNTLWQLQANGIPLEHPQTG